MSLTAMVLTLVWQPGWLPEANEAEQQQAIREIQKLGGEVKTSVKWNGRLVQLSLTKVHDADLIHLRALTDTRELWLGGTPVTDEGLVYVEGLKELRSLELTGTKITDAGLIHLSGLTELQHLSLWRTNITNAGLAHLKPLKKLSILSLSETGITDAGLVHLADFSDLQHLSLDRTRITDAGLAHLKQLKNLKRVSLMNTRATERGVREFQKSMPGVEVGFYFPNEMATERARKALIPGSLVSLLLMGAGIWFVRSSLRRKDRPGPLRFKVFVMGSLMCLVSAGMIAIVAVQAAGIPVRIYEWFR